MWIITDCKNTTNSLKVDEATDTPGPNRTESQLSAIEDVVKYFFTTFKTLKAHH